MWEWNENFLANHPACANKAKHPDFFLDVKFSFFFFFKLFLQVIQIARILDFVHRLLLSFFFVPIKRDFDNITLRVKGYFTSTEYNRYSNNILETILEFRNSCRYYEKCTYEML